MALNPVRPFIVDPIAGQYKSPVSMQVDSGGNLTSAVANLNQTFTSLNVTGGVTVGTDLTITAPGTIKQGANTLTLPAFSGTLALTSQIPASIFSPSFAYVTCVALNTNLAVWVLNTTPAGSGFSISGTNSSIINLPSPLTATWNYIYDANVTLTTPASVGSLTTNFVAAPTSSVLNDATSTGPTGTVHLHGCGVFNTTTGCTFTMTAVNIATISMLVSIVRLA